MFWEKKMARGRFARAIVFLGKVWMGDETPDSRPVPRPVPPARLWEGAEPPCLAPIDRGDRCGFYRRNEKGRSTWGALMLP